MEPDTSTDEPTESSDHTEDVTDLSRGVHGLPGVTTETADYTQDWLDECPPGETRSVTVGAVTFTRTVDLHNANESDLGKTLREIAYYAPPSDDWQSSIAYYETARAALAGGADEVAAPLVPSEVEAVTGPGGVTVHRRLVEPEGD